MLEAAAKGCDESVEDGECQVGVNGGVRESMAEISPRDILAMIHGLLILVPLVLLGVDDKPEHQRQAP